MKKLVKKVSKIISATIATASMILVSAKNTYAAGVSPSSGLSKAGIKASSGSASITTNLNSLVLIVITVAGFWIIGCIIFAGAKLAGSQGNQQARTQGFIGLAMSGFGAWVIMKAYDIAGWIAGFK